MTCEWTKKNIFTSSSTKKNSQLNTKNAPLWHFFFFESALFSFFRPRRMSSDIYPLSRFIPHLNKVVFLLYLLLLFFGPKRKRARREKLYHKGGGTAERRERRCDTLFIYYRSSVFIYIYSVCNLFFIASSFKRI